MKRPIKALFLDYSCTLVDDFEPVLFTHNTIRNMHGEDLIDRDQFRETVKEAPTFIGNYKVWKMIDEEQDEEKTLPENSEVYYDFLYTELYPTFGKLIEPFPYKDAEDVLSSLTDNGIKLIIVSLHPEDVLKRELKMLGLDKYFAAIYGNIEKKDEKILEIMEEMDISPEETAYMGDTVHDILYAEKAGVVSIAKYGGAYTTDDSLDEVLENVRKNGHPFCRIYDLIELAERIEMSEQPYLMLDTQ